MDKGLTTDEGLQATGLSCIRQERMIFQGLDVSLKAEELLWVRGRNGAGKSSLLRILARLLKPASGTVSWQGEAVEEDPDTYVSTLRYIGHHDGLKSAFTPRENLDFWVDYMGSGDVQAALERLELDRIADNPVSILSAGQKKRTHLARLVASPGKLWVLDEPISSLDTHYIDLFRSILSDHIKNGGMALLATHQDMQIEGTRVLDLDALKRGEA